MMRLAGKALLFLGLVLASDRVADRLLLSGLERYFGLTDPAEVALIGHSRMVLGVDPVHLEERLGVPLARYAVRGANLADRFAMIEHLVERLPRPPKVVVYSVSALLFDDDGLSSNSYRLFLPFRRDRTMFEYLQRRPDGKTDLRLCRLLHSTCWESATLALSLRGRFGLRRNLKHSEVNLQRLEQQIARGDLLQMRIDEGGFRTFTRTVSWLRGRDIIVVLLYLPILDRVNDLDRPHHDRLLARIQTLADGDGGTLFFDYNRDLESRHEIFYDGIHLNARGQRLVSRRLAEDLRSSLGQGRDTLREGRSREMQSLNPS
jgi:hypothetical protein